LFTTEQVARVRIIKGNTALGPNDNPGSGIEWLPSTIFSMPNPEPFPLRPVCSCSASG